MDVQGLQVVVLGLGKSGVAAAKLLHQKGAHVVVNDSAPESKVKVFIEELTALGIQVIAGGHPDDLITPKVKLVVKNPGIPYRIKPIQDAIQQQIPVVTEVELAGWYTSSPIIGITGSNGKTTTTTLVGEMLKEAEKSPIVAGNIGRALTDAILEANEEQPIVAELSSFQLMGTDQFRPRIGALLNIFPAHLDYHGTMDEYIGAKRKLFANQTSDDVAVLNWDQETGRETAEQVRSRVIRISSNGPVDNGVYLEKGKIVSSISGFQEILPVDQVALKGAHNLENILFASAISLAAGASLDAIRHVIETFDGVEHRLEFVREYKGVRFFNDSKATNSIAASKALLSFTNRIVWIAGGLDRGETFESLDGLLAERVKAVVALGQSREKILAAAKRAGIEKQAAAESIEAAVEQAAEFAAAGDVVLLSPACASWDMYSSFEERGRIFKQAVHTM